MPAGAARTGPGAGAGAGSRRRPWVAAVLLLGAALAGLDTLLWLRLERTLDRRLGGLVGAVGAAGWHLEATEGGRGGWPIAATRTLLHPTLHGGAGLLPGGIVWSGDAVTLSLSLLHPRQATVLADGTQTVTIAPASPLSQAFRFWGARISLRLPNPGGRSRDGLRLHADALHVAPAGAGPDDVAQLAELTARLRWPTAATAGPSDRGSLSLFLRDVAFPARFGAGADDARIVQRVRLEAGLAGRGGMAGPIIVREASIGWGGSRVALAGTVSPRPDGGLDGRLTLDAVDVAQALRRMREAGLIDAGTELAMAAVLGLVAEAEPGPHLRLPLALDDGTLALGQIPLLRLPPLPSR